MDAHRYTADLARWLNRARQQLTEAGGLSVRYAATDVDAFLSGVAADLWRGVLPDPEYLRDVTLRVTRLGRGYPQRRVDELIRGLERRIGEDPVIARITDAHFRTIRGDGYDPDEVDDFLDDLIQALCSGDRAAPPSGFSTARLRPGYSKQDVDALVSEIWPEWRAG